MGVSAGPAARPSGPIDWEQDWEVITRRLRRYAMALTGNRDEAEDLAQQTLAALFAKAPARADHMGYARRTLTRLWLDGQRSMRRRMARLLAAASASLQGLVGHSPSEEMHEQVRMLRRAIEVLPPRQRAVITLRLVEGLDYPAIAEATGCDVGAVRSSLHLARAKLREVLAEGEIRSGGM